MPADMPHLVVEHDDLRRSAREVADAPLRARLDEAESMIRQLVGICAAHEAPIPAGLDKDICAWLHQAASAREGQP